MEGAVMAQVVDLSRWQGVISAATFRNWKATGTERVIVKAGGADSGIYKDGAHDANIANIRAAALSAGHYFFNGPGDAAILARSFCAFAAPKPGDEMWEDIESEGRMGRWSATLALQVAEAVKADCGILPGYYMSSSVTREDNWAPAVAAGIPLWVAQYGGSAPAISYWKNYRYWQYTSQGSEPGYGGSLDLSTVGTRITSVAPANTYASINQTGHSTADLQAALNAHGAHLTVDGVPGPITEAAISAFEKANGLTVDGIAGPQVAGKLWPAGKPSTTLPKIAEDGIRGIQTVEAWQEVMGTHVNGTAASDLIKADQEFLNSAVRSQDIKNLTGKSKLAVDGVERENTIKVRQFWLFNKYAHTVLGRYPVAKDFDGVLGATTNKLHQHGLNGSSRGAKRY
jgi:GH25 family lysozyme M1 (1,4-beta-N-acetylmuramidase)